MIYHLADNGTMAVILPHGALFRGGAEGEIRRILIEKNNYLDAVIGLPANIFYGTSIPTCILVFKKCRENPDDILFIDASAHFEKVKNQNVLREADIARIVETYRIRASTDRYASAVSLSEIAVNDYNLNIPRYVERFDEEEQVDLDAVLGELKAIDSALEDVDRRIAELCTELGIETPL